MDSFIDIEEGNSKEAKWLKELASTIFRLFDSLDKDDDLLFINIIEAKRDHYCTIRSTVDAQKSGLVQKTELKTIGITHSEHSGSENEDHDGDSEEDS